MMNDHDAAVNDDVFVLFSLFYFISPYGQLFLNEYCCHVNLNMHNILNVQPKFFFNKIKHTFENRTS